MISVAHIDKSGRLTLEGHSRPVPWWSFTKTALAVAALRLVEEKLLTLNDALPDEKFTLAQLLRHEAGLTDYGSLPSYHRAVADGETPWSVERLLVETEAHHLLFEPGRGWAYSNIGYWRVARLVEQASALPLQEALRALVFAPAGAAGARLAQTPRDLADVEMAGDRGYHPGWVYHGLVVGTAADAARVLQALTSGRLLAPETFKIMTQSKPLPEHRSETYPNPAYALGLMLWADQLLDHPLGHTGDGPGSRFAVYSQGGRTSAIWAASPITDDPVTRVFRALALALAQGS